MPKSYGFKNLVVHPNSINPLQASNEKFVEWEEIRNKKILIQLFVRGKPFIGLDYNNDYCLEALKKLEIEERLLGIIIYGCPYLFDKIKQTIHESIPLAYSPSQEDEAQNQILSNIFEPETDVNELDKKFNNEFTD